MSENESRIDFCLDWIKRIVGERGDINTKDLEALKYYRGDETIVPTVEGRSKATTTDVMDNIETIKPYILETFAGGDEAVSLEPQGEEDVRNVENLSIEVNHNVRVKNNWPILVNDWMHDLLTLRIAYFKYAWVKEVEEIEKQYTELSDMEFQAKISQPSVEVVSVKETVIAPEGVDAMMMPVPAVKSYDVTLKHIIEDEFVKIEVVPKEEVGYPITSKCIEDAPFFYHKRKFQEWEFKKTFGKGAISKVKELRDQIYDPEAKQITEERFRDLGNEFLWDEDEKKWVVYECYFREPNEGKPWITTICGDVVLVDEYNKYRKPPFQGATPYKMSHRVEGMSPYDLLKNIQRTRTAILRQVIDNLYQANFRRYFADTERLNTDDYLNNNVTNSLIRVTGDPNTVVRPEDKAPLPAELFTFWEMIQAEKDYHGKVPRSFQGVNPDVLNKTFRGQAQQINQASQGVQMLLRVVAEMCVSPLMRDVANTIIQFKSKKSTRRLMNQWVEITPDNVVCRADFIVNVGLGTGSKENRVMQMQQLLGLYGQIYSSGIPIVSPDNAYNALKELIKAMGYKNTSDFCTNPNFMQAVQQLAMAVQQHMMMMQQAGMQIDPMLMQAVQGVMAMGGQIGNTGTNPEQNVAPQPEVAAQPLPQMTTIPNGEYFG